MKYDPDEGPEDDDARLHDRILTLIILCGWVLVVILGLTFFPRVTIGLFMISTVGVAVALIMLPKYHD
jgi:hypothetical protein